MSKQYLPWWLAHYSRVWKWYDVVDLGVSCDDTITFALLQLSQFISNYQSVCSKIIADAIHSFFKTTTAAALLNNTVNYLNRSHLRCSNWFLPVRSTPDDQQHDMWYYNLSFVGVLLPHPSGGYEKVRPSSTKIAAIVWRLPFRTDSVLQQLVVLSINVGALLRRAIFSALCCMISSSLSHQPCDMC